MSDIYIHILNLIEAMFFCEHCKKYWNFTQSPSVEIHRKWTVYADPWVIHSKICGNCPLTEKLQTRNSEEISALCAMEGTFAIIYLCLLFSAGLHFSIKYVSYDSFKIFFVFPNCKKRHNFEIFTTTCFYMILDIYLL